MNLWIIIVILAAGTGILAICLICYEKQVRHLKKQLEFLKAEDSNQLLTSVCAVGQTGEMINVMNQVLEKMREEQRKLYRANRSYRESITGISHDIRTPLTSMKGYVQLLEHPGTSKEKKEQYLRTVERRMEDLTELLNQLFEYARLEAGELELNREKLNVTNLFVETVSMFYEDFAKKSCEPTVDVPREPCFVYGDAHAWQRVTENLIKNALVHGTGGYAFSLLREQGQAVMRIANETKTIQERDLEQIFERFYTTDQSGNRRSTGLGLAIAREFTEKMGGRIQASLKQGIFEVEVRFETG